MQKIIVTGGLGFIGSNLIRMLLKKNYYVINIDKVNYASNFYNLTEVSSSQDLLSSDQDDEEDDLEIPAFLRRQKN